MIYLEELKLIAEVITAVATASVVIIHLVKLCKPIKIFFKTTIPLFIKGTTNLEEKKIRGFKALKQQREKIVNFVAGVSPGFEMEDVLVLDKKALWDIISNSAAFHTIRQRKK